MDAFAVLEEEAGRPHSSLKHTPFHSLKSLSLPGVEKRRADSEFWPEAFSTGGFLIGKECCPLSQHALPRRHTSP